MIYKNPPFGIKPKGGFVYGELVQISRQQVSCAGVFTDHLHLAVGLVIEVDALFQDALVSFCFLLAVDVDPILAFGFVGIPDFLQILGQVDLNLSLVAEYTETQSCGMTPPMSSN